jgi:hypothetical protein
MTKNPTPIKVYYSFIKYYYRHDITVTYSNDKGVRRYYDTTRTAFYGEATRSTEILNFDPDNFWVSGLLVTDQHVQVTLA